MPTQVTYSEALQLSTYCYVVDEFLQEYGIATRWKDCMIDAGELMAFIDNVMSNSF
jgi:hypothetical protein